MTGSRGIRAAGPGRRVDLAPLHRVLYAPAANGPAAGGRWLVRGESRHGMEPFSAGTRRIHWRHNRLNRTRWSPANHIDSIQRRDGFLFINSLRRCIEATKGFPGRVALARPGRLRAASVAGNQHAEKTVPITRCFSATLQLPWIRKRPHRLSSRVLTIQGEHDRFDLKSRCRRTDK